jgi:hypothetical protein
VIARIAGVVTDGDCAAAKRIFACSTRDDGVNVPGAVWYRSSREPQVASLGEGWANGLAMAAGQFATGVTDPFLEFRSDDAERRHPEPVSNTNASDRKPAVRLSEAVPDAPGPGTSRNELPPAPVRRGRGRTPGLRQSVETAMLEALDNGTLSIDALGDMTEEALAAQFKVSRTLVRKVRKSVLAVKDINLNTAMRIFEQDARVGAIKVYQAGPSGDHWVAPLGLWRPGSLNRWAGGLALDGGQFAWGKIYPNLEVRLADAARRYPGHGSDPVGRERPPAPVRPSRGPRPKKSEAVERAMYEKVERGTLLIDALVNTTEEALAAEYGVSRTTARRAKNSVLARRNSISE